MGNNIKMDLKEMMYVDWIHLAWNRTNGICGLDTFSLGQDQWQANGICELDTFSLGQDQQQANGVCRLDTFSLGQDQWQALKNMTVL